MEECLRAYAASPSELAGVLSGADLAFLYLRMGDPVENLLEAASRMLHRRGNLVVAGRFPMVWEAFSLMGGWATHGLVLLTRPVLESPFLPATAHRLALVAWRDPAHIQNIEVSFRGGKVVGNADVLSGKRSPLSKRWRTRLSLALHALGKPESIPLEVLAELVERYSDPGGLVVDLGSPAGPFGLVAWALGRKAAVALPSEVEAQALREEAKALRRPARARRVRVARA